MQGHDRDRLKNLFRSFASYLVYCGILFFMGCGYHFQESTGSLPSDVRSLSIPLFSNRTMQTGIESEVTRALVEKFISAGRLPIRRQDSADALLTGAVKSFSTTSVTVTGETQVTTGYRATLTVEVIFQRQRDGRILWKEEMSDWWNYSVVSDLALTEKNKKDAIRQISLLLAEKIHELILENF
jgi:outer membrane lipopolysaccharide assembly protein LptE/RlpB